MRILILGGASGLGKAITERLANENHEIIITYCRSAAAAAALKESHQVQAFQCDFKSKESVDKMVEVIKTLNLDAVINNALTGIHKQHFHKIKKETFLNSFQENVYSTLLLTQAAIKIFRKKRFGKIINILSSALYNTPPIGLSEYVANKAYLLSMSKSWAHENGKYNVTSNSISPSFMMTPLNKFEDERLVENMTKAHPLKTLLKEEEVAEAVSFLINASQQINGINLPINAAENVI